MNFHQIIQHFHFLLITMTVRPKRNYDITALQRGLRLLHLFSESPRGLTAKQVAALSRLPVSTVHRFLANLVTHGVPEPRHTRVPTTSGSRVSPSDRRRQVSSIFGA